MEVPGNSTLLNVCIIPDEHVSNKLITVSKSLKSEETIFTLGEGFLPHMTVYMARYPNDIINAMFEATEQTLKDLTSIICIHSGYFLTEGRYLEASYRKSESLLDLQELLIKHDSKFRLNPGSPFREAYFAPYSFDQQKNAEQTGYDLAGKLYRPHISLTRYRQDGVPTMFPSIPALDLSFSMSKICIYKADENGQAYELVRTFKIS
jgi:2'-5' RNA ligase